MKREKPKAVRAVIKMNIEGKIGGERQKKKKGGWIQLRRIQGQLAYV